MSYIYILANLYCKLPFNFAGENIQRNVPGHGAGHAVVLIGCTPQYLKFMSSWGQDWADGGYFRVRDERALREMKFYDIYSKENKLTIKEKEAFQRDLQLSKRQEKQKR